MLTAPTFKHEIEWYEYHYYAEKDRVGICCKQLEPCTVHFYNREQLLQLIEREKYNPFSLPIYKRALEEFPKGDIK